MSKLRTTGQEETKVPFQVDQNAYTKVSRCAFLQEIRLVDSSYNIKPDVIAVLKNLDDLDLQFSGECLGIDFDEDDGVAVGQFEWIAEIKDGRKKCLKIKSRYLLIYTGFDDCDADHVGYFFAKVGRFATYPYFRSHFSHNISESGLMMPPLPTLRERVD